MSSLDIVRDIRTLAGCKLNPRILKKWQRQFMLGVKAYSLKPFQSAASNSRSVIPNAHTAATKTDRLLTNSRLADTLGLALDALDLLRPGSFVSIDHSDMHGLTALVGAVQTRKGRSIPVIVETTYALQIPARSDKPSKQKHDKMSGSFLGRKDRNIASLKASQNI